VLFAAPDFTSSARRLFSAASSHARQAIEQTFEFLSSHGDRSRYALQALPSTRFSAPNDALRSRKRSTLAFSSPQRARFWPHDFAGWRVIRAPSRNAA
jgi:hypothetical protein